MQVHIEKDAAIHNSIFVEKMERLSLQNNQHKSENITLKTKIVNVEKKNEDLQNENRELQNRIAQLETVMADS